MNILFATDGSDSAARAQRLVASTSWPEPAQIRVLHVEPLPHADLVSRPDLDIALHGKVAEWIESELATATQALAGPGREVSSAMAIGRPADVILDHARTMPADVIVLGSHGRGAFASAVLGSVAAEVVDGAPSPVLVARTDTISRVMLATDGSDGARQAEAVLTDWPFLRSVPIHVVTTWTVAPAYSSVDLGGGFLSGDVLQQVIHTARGDAERVVSGAVERLAAAGAKASSEIRDAPAAPGIVAAAGNAGADLIVIGTRGRTGLARLVLGSVARGVLHRARVSVLTVRQSAPTG